MILQVVACIFSRIGAGLCGARRVRAPGFFKHSAFPRSKCLYPVCAHGRRPLPRQFAIRPRFPLHRVRVVEDTIEFLHFPTPFVDCYTRGDPKISRKSTSAVAWIFAVAPSSLRLPFSSAVKEWMATSI